VGLVILALLTLGEQVDQNCSHPDAVENARNALVARAVPAAAAAMSEQHRPLGLLARFTDYCIERNPSAELKGGLSAYDGSS
jgi:hypothetical protein